MKPRPIAIALLAAAVLACAAPAHAQRFLSPTQRLLLDAPSPAALRARLVAHADSVVARAPQDAGAAWHWTGVSFYRAGRPDSATAAFRRAWALRANPDDALGMAEAWSATGRSADAESALAFVATLPEEGPEAGTPALRLWRAYAAARLAGPAGRAAALAVAHRELDALARAGGWVSPWVLRLAPLFAEARVETTWALAWTSAWAAQARGREPRLMALVRESSLHRTNVRSFEAWWRGEVEAADPAPRVVMRALGLRPLAVRAAGGDTLRAWWLPARDPAAPLVVALAPLEVGRLLVDSLAVQLHREGIAFALLEPRGTGGSCVRGCALPADWLGHEDSLTRVVAADLSATIAAVTRAAGRAPAHVALAGEREYVLATTFAARDDRRVGALLLAGIAPSPAEQGTLVATLAHSGVPLFVQTSVEDFEGNQLTDRIVARLPARLTRVAESEAPGRGYEAFRFAGPDVGRRFTQWLREAWSRPRATPPAPPR